MNLEFVVQKEFCVKRKMLLICVVVALLFISVNAQRPSFAGGRSGSGYKDAYVQPPTTNTDKNFIANRNSENENSVVNQTPNLPIDARGDANLVYYLNNLPFEQRPFWLVNQQHIEAHRNTPTRRPADSSITQSTLNSMNTASVANRINIDGSVFLSAFNTNAQLPNNQQNSGSQLHIVHPSKITPEQRIEMEIRFLQQSQNALKQIRQQSQQPNQQDINNIVQHSR